MCRRATCKTCGKITWAGCGQHVASVMAGLSEDQKCKCATHNPDSGLFSNPILLIALLYLVYQLYTQYRNSQEQARVRA